MLVGTYFYFLSVQETEEPTLHHEEFEYNSQANIHLSSFCLYLLAI